MASDGGGGSETNARRPRRQDGRAHTFGHGRLPRRLLHRHREAIERTAAKSGTVILLIDIHGSGEGLERRLALLRMHGVDGILATDCNDMIGQLNLPTVVIGAPVADLDGVRSDDAAGGVALAEHLIRKGLRSIGLASSRAAGCVQIRREAMIAGLTGDVDIAWESFASASDNLTSSIRHRLKERSLTAVACSSDEIAIEVIHTLMDIGIDVPREISVVGFDDIPWATVIRPAREALARAAVKAFAERMPDPGRSVQHVVLPVTLVERETVRDLSDSPGPVGLS